MKGKITRIVSGKDFFFIDGDYFCHLSKIKFDPKIGDEVEYERSKNEKNEKPEAKNVTLITLRKSLETSSESTNYFDFNKYLSALEEGYFVENGFIKREFTIDFAKELAKMFGKNSSMNKTTQIRKYFDFCRKVEGIYKVKRNFNYVSSELPKLIYHVNNAFNKKPSLVSTEFCQFIKKNVEMAIQNENNFLKGFICHFEAVVGFSNNN